MSNLYSSSPIPNPSTMFDGVGSSGIDMHYLFYGIGTIFARLSTLIMVLAGIGLAFLIANKIIGVRNGESSDNVEMMQSFWSSITSNLKLKGNLLGLRSKGFYGSVQRTRNVGNRAVNIARRSFRNTFLGKKHSNRIRGYAVKSVDLVSTKMYKRRTKYGIHKLGDLGRTSKKHAINDAAFGLGGLFLGKHAKKTRSRTRPVYRTKLQNTLSTKGKNRKAGFK